MLHRFHVFLPPTGKRSIFFTPDVPLPPFSSVGIESKLQSFPKRHNLNSYHEQDVSLTEPCSQSWIFPSPPLKIRFDKRIQTSQQHTRLWDGAVMPLNHQSVSSSHKHTNTQTGPSLQVSRCLCSLERAGQRLSAVGCLLGPRVLEGCRVLGWGDSGEVVCVFSLEWQRFSMSR